MPRLRVCAKWASTDAHAYTVGGWEYEMGSRPELKQRGGGGGGGGKDGGEGGSKEKGLIWFGSGEVIIPFPHFTAHP